MVIKRRLIQIIELSQPNVSEICAKDIFIIHKEKDKRMFYDVIIFSLLVSV